MDEIAQQFGVVCCVVKDWRDRGLLLAHVYNDRGQCLYEPPATDLPRKFKRKQAYLVAKAKDLSSTQQCSMKPKPFARTIECWSASVSDPSP